MSPNLKNFYLSACLSILTLSLCGTNFPANAAFEWTPPENLEAPPISSSKDSALPEEPLEEKQSEEESAVKTKEQFLDAFLPEPKENKPSPTQKETETTEPSQTAAPPPSLMTTKTIDPVDSKTDLTINPFPLNEESTPKNEHATTIPPVLLPLDMPSETPVTTEKDSAHAQETQSFEIVEGFGNDMPLALALRQIVPPRYAFSFGAGVNPGIRVSWNGGKPWNEVVIDMLTPYNLHAIITTKAVLVTTIKPVEEKWISITPTPTATPEQEQKDTASSATVPDSIKERATHPKLEKAGTRGEEMNTNEETYSARMSDDATANLTTDKENTSIARRAILDPGMSENRQPAAISPEQKEKQLSQPENQGRSMSNKAHTKPTMEKTEPALYSIHIDKSALTKIRVWEAKQGESLKDILYQWSRETGVNLVWNSSQDYKLSSNILVSGTYENAIKVLFLKAIKNGPQYTFDPDQKAELIIGNK